VKKKAKPLQCLMSNSEGSSRIQQTDGKHKLMRAKSQSTRLSSNRGLETNPKRHQGLVGEKLKKNSQGGEADLKRAKVRKVGGSDAIVT
jgi:hypothetical protein